MSVTRLKLILKLKGNLGETVEQLLRSSSFAQLENLILKCSSYEETYTYSPVIVTVYEH